MHPFPVTRRARGFTLIELMVAVAVLAILSAVALPAYNTYITRSRVPVALDALSAYQVRMEQVFQDTGGYAANGNCAVALPTNVTNFAITCALSGTTAFTATATGSGTMAGYAYTIDQAGNRATTAHPKGTNASCWTTKGGTCDS